MIKIAISGKARAGKNTLSSLLVKNFNVNEGQFKTLAFADTMKQIIEIMFPESKKECLYGKSELRQNIISPIYSDKEKNLLTYRQALIDLGKFGRDYNDNIWINKIKLELQSYDDDTKLVILNDCRFINEFSFLQENNFFTIRIKRDNSLKINDVSEKQQEEIPDDAFDFIIYNNSTMEDLENSVKLLISNRFSKLP